jgi:hypothetical protein
MQFTVAAVAAALGKTKQAVQKEIINKRVSTVWDETVNPRRRMIDASEIARVWLIDMTLPPSKRQPLVEKDSNQINAVADLLKAKDDMIALLKEQLIIKDDQIKNYGLLLAAPKPEEAAVKVMPTPAAPMPVQAATEAVEAIKTEIEAETHPAPVEAPKNFWRRLVG